MNPSFLGRCPRLFPPNAFSVTMDAAASLEVPIPAGTGRTSTRKPEEPKDPDSDHLYQLFSLFAGDQQRAEMAATYRRGGFGYGEVKKTLADLAEGFFAEARQRRHELEAHPQQVREILGVGAARARKKAAEVLLRAQRACGVKGNGE